MVNSKNYFIYDGISLLNRLALLLTVLLLSTAVQANNHSAEAKVYDGHQQFGLNLMRVMVKAEPTGNVFIAPLSSILALSMLTNGATSDTRKAMLQSMGLENINLDIVNQANLALLTNLRKQIDEFNARPPLWRTGDPLSIAIANSLWINKGIDVNKDFQSEVEKFYEADVSSLDFKSNDATDTLNGWAAQKTNNKITNIVDSQELRNAQMLLANVTYFRASWANAFSESETKTGEFTLQNGDQHNALIMSQTTSIPYRLHEDYTAVKLNYAGDTAHMVIMIPKSGSLVDFIQNRATQQSTYHELDNSWRHGAKVALTMPKFKFAWDKVLNDDLAELGMGVMFSDSADFSLLSDGTLKVGFVKKKTFVQVDEAGTEAAAVTSIGIERVSSALRPTIVNIDVDKPFFFAIRDNKTGHFLFMGAVQKPEWKN